MYLPRNVAARFLVKSTRICSRGLSNASYDVCVIGSGPGGYVAAIKAAQLGLKTACVEKSDTFGGTCLNVGCIPSKSLLHNSHLYHLAKTGQLKSRGIVCDNVSLDLNSMMSQKDSSVKSLTQGVSILFKANKITPVKGVGKIIGKGEVQVSGDGGVQTLSAKNIIIATGSTVTPFPGIKINEKNIVSSTGALSLPSVPAQMAVIGAGAIGLELGSVWSRLGSKVTVVELLDRIGGPSVDKEVSTQLLRIMRKQGVQFRLETKVETISDQGAAGEITVKCRSNKGSEEQLQCDVLIVAVGRRAYTEGLGLENVDVKLDKAGRIIVDNNFKTNVDGIYAIGDCIKGPMLAHKAEDEGIMCAEHIANGAEPHLDYNHVPNVIYTYPEVAWVGHTEDALKEQGRKIRIGKFPMAANSRAKTIGEVDGFCKVLADADTGLLLGAHIVNSVAGELISEAVLAMDNQLTCEDIARSCHPHPTWSESFKEANLHAACGKAINNIG